MQTGAVTFPHNTGDHVADVRGFPTLRDVVYGGSFEGYTTMAIGVRATPPLCQMTRRGVRHAGDRCDRARKVMPTLSDRDLWRALRAVHRLSDDVLGGRYVLAEGAEEQLLGIALMVRREVARRWGQ